MSEAKCIYKVYYYFFFKKASPLPSLDIFKIYFKKYSNSLFANFFLKKIIIELNKENGMLNNKIIDLN